MIPWWGYLIGAIMLMAAGGYAGYQVTAWAKDEEINRIKLADAKDLHNRLVAAQTDFNNRIKASQKADADYAKTHPQIVTVTQTIIEKVPYVVTQKVDAEFPVPCAVVRVFDAAAIGTDPDALPYPTGLADDKACPIKASVLAKGGASAIRGYVEVAHQLTSLQGWINDQLALNPK